KLARRITLGKIIALTGRSEMKAKKALEFGADRAVISKEEDPVEEIIKETGGKGVDVIFEAAGVEDTLKVAFRTLRPGGKLISLGVFDKALNIDFNPVVFFEYQIAGSNAYSYGDFKKAIELVSENRVDLSSLISQEIPLERLEETLKERDPEKIKIIVKP
ncbi:MAG: zinc-binding dehydrogenase, partial [Candidatus Bathyarchaeia archaeon]